MHGKPGPRQSEGPTRKQMSILEEAHTELDALVKTLEQTTKSIDGDQRQVIGDVEGVLLGNKERDVSRALEAVNRLYRSGGGTLSEQQALSINRALQAVRFPSDQWTAVRTAKGEDRHRYRIGSPLLGDAVESVRRARDFMGLAVNEQDPASPNPKATRRSPEEVRQAVIAAIAYQNQHPTLAGRDVAEHVGLRPTQLSRHEQWKAHKKLKIQAARKQTGHTEWDERIEGRHHVVDDDEDA